MNINDHSFHDAVITEVREQPNQILDFYINFAVDWENNIYEPSILRFIDVTNYTSTAIPFTGTHTILEVNELPDNTITLGSFSSEFTFTRKVVELITNAGKRIIEYSTCDLTTAH